MDEPDETFTVQLSNPVNAVFAGNALTLEATVTIKEDNSANNNNPVYHPPSARFNLPSLVFSRTRLSLNEGGSTSYQVRAASSRGVGNTIVNLETAHSGITVNPSKLMFTPSDWQTYQTVTVTAGAFDLQPLITAGERQTYQSWEPIGLFANPFQAVLAGNGHTIHNLFQDQSDASRFAGKPSGLFGAIGNRGQVVGLGLEEVDIKGVNWVGAIAGLSQGVISHCSVSGQVVGSNSVGGLVGHNFGNIAHSFVNAEVSGVIGVSVFVGWNVGGSIESSSAQGRVNGATSAGDLVGLGTPAR